MQVSFIILLHRDFTEEYNFCTYYLVGGLLDLFLDIPGTHSAQA